MKSLWKFPGIPLSEPVRLYLKRIGLKFIRQIGVLHPLVHHYTVHREELHPVMLGVDGKGVKSTISRWVRLRDLNIYPMPSVYRKMAVTAIGLLSEK